MSSYTVTFEVDLSSEEGRKEAEHLESWLAKERYDCPDQKVAGEFNGIMMDLRDSLYTGDRGSAFGQTFDQTNRNWTETPEHNLLFLKTVQNQMNSLLHTRGHVFLNEVYDALGFKRTTEGALKGWLSDTSIEFMISEMDDGYFVDFNVQGVIYDKI